MEVNEICQRGRLLNTIIIIINLVTYISYFIGKYTDSGFVWGLQTAIRVIGVVGAIVIIIYTAILLKQNEGQLKGLGLLLAASIVSLIFSALGFMLGIVIWVLCGISMSQLQKSFKEYSDTLMYSNISSNLSQKNNFGNNNYDDPFAGNDVYGNQTYGNQTYGNQNYQGYGNQDSQGYGNQTYQDYGNQTSGNQTYQGYGNETNTNQNYSGDPFANAQGYGNANYTDPFANAQGYGSDTDGQK